MPRLALFAQGLDQYPDRSATLLLQVPGLEGGPAVTLAGPGMREAAEIAPAGLPDWFWNDWRLNAAQFPLGVDIFFTCGRSVIGLPRSIQAEG
jgi:alpha-D-ribose 1-methylphosphonate 5-triphosphate synthase subunit PhnH